MLGDGVFHSIPGPLLDQLLGKLGMLCLLMIKPGLPQCGRTDDIMQNDGCQLGSFTLETQRITRREASGLRTSSTLIS
jgi:hypothetical protein